MMTHTGRNMKVCGNKYQILVTVFHDILTCIYDKIFKELLKQSSKKNTSKTKQSLWWNFLSG